MMTKKHFPAQVKVLLDSAGQPTGQVTFKEWADSGNPLPIVFSHDWDDPFAIIGYADVAAGDVKSDEHGLLITATLDIKDNPTAAQVFRLMQRGVVREASFAFNVIEEEKDAKDGANNLKELGLIEAGPCLKGMNPATSVVSVKSENVGALLEFAREHADEFEEFVAKSLETKSWDGSAAMHSAHDAGEFAKIAFERDNDSDPDTAAHWALPHHNSPGADANPDGVAAALGALHGGRGGAPDLKNGVDAAEKHLLAHKAAASDEKDAAPTSEGAGDGSQAEDPSAVEPDYTDKHPKEKAGARHSRGDLTLITQAIAALTALLPVEQEDTMDAEDKTEELDTLEPAVTSGEADGNSPTEPAENNEDDVQGFAAPESETKDLDADADPDEVALDGDQNEPADEEDPAEEYAPAKAAQAEARKILAEEFGIEVKAAADDSTAGDSEDAGDEATDDEADNTKGNSAGDCPSCGGTGNVDGAQCEACGGTGTMATAPAEGGDEDVDESMATKAAEMNTIRLQLEIMELEAEL
jgi:HK97 family phage prohead protease